MLQSNVCEPKTKGCSQMCTDSSVADLNKIECNLLRIISSEFRCAQESSMHGAYNMQTRYIWMNCKMKEFMSRIYLSNGFKVNDPFQTFLLQTVKCNQWRDLSYEPYFLSHKIWLIFEMQANPRKIPRVDWVKLDLEWPEAMKVCNSDLEWNSKNELLEY